MKKNTLLKIFFSLKKELCQIYYICLIYFYIRIWSNCIMITIIKISLFDGLKYVIQKKFYQSFKQYIIMKINKTLHKVNPVLNLIFKFS